MSAITALTAQNTLGVTAILDATPEFLAAQLDAVFTDIFPDAVKIGMVSSAELIHVISQKLQEYGAKHIVLDPVMVATSGARLISEDAVEVLQMELLPLAEVATHNLPEAEKGGHHLNDANDFLWEPDVGHWFQGQRIENPNTHGTGCTLSSAIASELALGASLQESVKRAKAYLSGALSAMLDLGQGRGPMNHLYHLHGAFIQEQSK